MWNICDGLVLYLIVVVLASEVFVRLRVYPLFFFWLIIILWHACKLEQCEQGQKR